MIVKEALRWMDRQWVEKDLINMRQFWDFDNWHAYYNIIISHCDNVIITVVVPSIKSYKYKSYKSLQPRHTGLTPPTRDTIFFVNDLKSHPALEWSDNTAELPDLEKTVREGNNTVGVISRFHFCELPFYSLPWSISSKNCPKWLKTGVNIL